MPLHILMILLAGKILHRPLFVKILIILTFFLSASHLYASQGNVSISHVKNMSLQQFVCEITKYCLTGYTLYDEVTPFKDVSMYAAGFSGHYIWTAKRHRPVRLYELYYKDSIHSSIISDSSFDFIADDLSFDDLYTDDADLNDNLISELVFTDKDNEVRRFIYGDEQFFTDAFKSGHIMYSVADGKIKRKIYDSLYRLKKKEVFVNISNVNDISLEDETEFFYEDEKEFPYKSYEYNKTKKTTVEILYTDFNKVKNIQECHYELEKSGEANSEVLLKDKETDFEYDDENRLVREDLVLFSHKMNRHNRRMTDKTYIKRLYIYHDDNISPDILYYENGNLRVKTLYADEKSYTEFLYFDDGFTIETFYEDGLKIRESVMLNGVEQRSISFDNR